MKAVLPCSYGDSELRYEETARPKYGVWRWRSTRESACH